MRVLRGNRTLWVVAATAVLSLAGGLLVGRFVISPADAAASAKAPDPGLVTVPVELGVLKNDVVARGDVGFADPVEVTIDTAESAGAAVVTGHVPEVNATLDATSIALEVAGRPVIVLPGELPAYRSLRLGDSGPDVLQLKQALAAVGISPGDANSPAFDTTTANAVGRLYSAVGYPAPKPPEGSDEALRSAQQGVGDADRAIQAALDELHRASAGASAVDVTEADNLVASAQRQVAAAQAQSPVDPHQVADMRDALRLAQLRRAQLDLPADTSAQRAAVDAARAQRAAAAEGLEAVRAERLPFLPAGEVLYLTQLPRRVDDVAVTRGQILQGAAMTVSGADVRITATVAEADAGLLDVGMAAEFELPDGTTHGATIAGLEPPAKSETRWSLVLTPDELTAEQSRALQTSAESGDNVRMVLPVGATDGEVLQVPLAALTAGPGGESRVEVAVDDPDLGERARTRLVVVTTGLAAGGYVEVAAVDGDLAKADLVVVGR